LAQLQEQRVSAKEDEDVNVEDEDEEEVAEAERQENIVLEKQLAWAEHRIKELEALIAKAVSPCISRNLSSSLQVAFLPQQSIFCRTGPFGMQHCDFIQDVCDCVMSLPWQSCCHARMCLHIVQIQSYSFLGVV
jgi:hypothetical protein